MWPVEGDTALEHELVVDPSNGCGLLFTPGGKHSLLSLHYTSLFSSHLGVNTQSLHTILFLHIKVNICHSLFLHLFVLLGGLTIITPSSQTCFLHLCLFSHLGVNTHCFLLFIFVYSHTWRLITVLSSHLLVMFTSSHKVKPWKSRAKAGQFNLESLHKMSRRMTSKKVIV